MERPIPRNESGQAGDEPVPALDKTAPGPTCREALRDDCIIDVFYSKKSSVRLVQYKTAA